jgi:hypothetical protein
VLERVSQRGALSGRPAFLAARVGTPLVVERVGEVEWEKVHGLECGLPREGTGDGLRRPIQRALSASEPRLCSADGGCVARIVERGGLGAAKADEGDEGDVVIPQVHLL